MQLQLKVSVYSPLCAQFSLLTLPQFLNENLHCTAMPLAMHSPHRNIPNFAIASAAGSAVSCFFGIVCVVKLKPKSIAATISFTFSKFDPFLRFSHRSQYVNRDVMSVLFKKKSHNSVRSSAGSVFSFFNIFFLPLR